MPSTRSQEDKTTTGDKREGEEHSEQGKNKVRKVVVGKEGKDESGKGEGSGGELKQQKLAVEKGDEGKEDDGNLKVGEPAASTEASEANKSEQGKEATNDKDDKKEKQLSSREQGEKDGGSNAEPGEKPDLSHVPKGDYERKHGTLETGHVYFVYRPKVEVEEPHSLDDVSKFHLLLVPHHSKLHRLLAIGKKALPDHDQSSRPLWGEVLNVGEDMKSLKKNLGSYSYETKTMGSRYQPGSRVAASGVYILHATENYPKDSQNMSAVYETKFAYQVALPHEMGEVQEALHIHPSGSFSLQVKNPESPSNNPAAPTQDPSKHPQFPESLQSLFRTKFIPANPPALLDYPGAELLLLPSKHNVHEDIGNKAEKELQEEEDELEDDIEKQTNGDEVKKALKEAGLDGLIEGKALEGHWE
ncbi:hypothetical protein JCM16303_005396 [Sporobolomyces ruberrimus]